jgi:hypothetical protein
MTMSKVYIPATLRQLVYERAKGCCEYCLMPETVALAPHEVDHIIAKKHGGRTEADNLALSCTLCNKHKGTDLTSIDPHTGQIASLYHPRQNRWREHFRLDGSQFVPLTPTGRVTVRLLHLNHPQRVEERQFLLVANMLPTKGLDEK